MRILKKEDFKISNWSGGKTTELFIYPENTSYFERNFKFRISSALVEIDESTFTNLPGVNRIIMILDGQVILNHEGQGDVNLGKYDQNSFSGTYNTKCYGKASDFNVMLREGAACTIEAIRIKASPSDEVLTISLQENCEIQSDNNFLFFYVAEGSISLEYDLKSYHISSGDLVIFQGLQSSVNKAIILNGDGVLIKVKINL